MRGYVESIESMGLVDGPGIRTVVFLGGCLLRCKYCHNPETWKMLEPNMTAEELANKIIRNKPYFKRNNFRFPPFSLLNIAFIMMELAPFISIFFRVSTRK